MGTLVARREHAEAWAQLRHALWPDTSLEQHLQEIYETLDQEDPDAVTFIAESAGGQIAGFAEAALRRDYVNGCGTSPVLFLEESTSLLNIASVAPRACFARQSQTGAGKKAAPNLPPTFCSKTGTARAFTRRWVLMKRSG